MGKRGQVSDYAGEELRVGDLINYAARRGNGVRVTDAIIENIAMEREGRRIVPVLTVKPTGSESGFFARKRIRRQRIYTEHVRLIRPGVGLPPKS